MKCKKVHDICGLISSYLIINMQKFQNKNSKSEILSAPSISDKAYSTRITLTVEHIQTFDILTFVKRLGTGRSHLMEGRVCWDQQVGSRDIEGMDTVEEGRKKTS